MSFFSLGILEKLFFNFFRQRVFHVKYTIAFVNHPYSTIKKKNLQKDLSLIISGAVCFEKGIVNEYAG